MDTHGTFSCCDFKHAIQFLCKHLDLFNFFVCHVSFWLLIFSSKFILLKVKDKNALSYAQV